MVPIDADKSARRKTWIRSSPTGNAMGKRYVDETGAEVLVTKAGSRDAQHRDHRTDLEGSKGRYPASD